MKNRRRAPPPPQGGTKTTRLRLTLRLKDDTLQRPTHENIFEITHTKLDCFLTEIRDINNGGFSVTSDMQSTIGSLVSPKGRQELAKINLAPVPSPKITAERTVFISRLSRHVCDRPAIEIQNEIIRANPNINNIQVHKIKHYYHIIKVVCEDTETADAVTRDGLYSFHTKIAASQCKKEQYTELKTCFRCYKFEDHFFPLTAKQLKSSVASAPRSATPTGTAMQSKKDASIALPGKTSIEHLPPSVL